MFGRSDIRSELLSGREVGENIDLAVEWDGVVVKITLNDETLLECTRNDAMFAMLGLMRYFGKKTTKDLMRIQPSDGWKHRSVL